MNFKGTKVLETPRLILRPWKEKDAFDIFKNYCSDDEVTKYLTWKTHKTIDESIEFLKTRFIKEPSKRFEWAITLKGSDEVVGSIDIVVLYQENDKWIGEIGYVLSRKLWGKGMMTEALMEVTKYLFLECDIDEIKIRSDVRNIGSYKVQKKAHYIDINETFKEVIKGKDVEMRYTHLTKEMYLKNL